MQEKPANDFGDTKFTVTFSSKGIVIVSQPAMTQENAMFFGMGVCSMVKTALEMSSIMGEVAEGTGPYQLGHLRYRADPEKDISQVSIQVLLPRFARVNLAESLRRASVEYTFSEKGGLRIVEFDSD